MVNIQDEILKKILDNITLTPEGEIRRQGIQILEYNRYLSLFLSDLTTDTHVQSKLNHIRYHFTSEDSFLLGNELSHIFKEMKLEGKSTFTEFKEKLNLMLQKIEDDSKPVKFELYYPLNITNEEKVSVIRFKDTQIDVLTYEEVKNLLESEKLKQDLRLERFTKTKYQYIRVTLWARNQIYAQYISTKYVHMILGFITFSQNYQNTSVTFIGPPKELTELKLNYIFVFDKGTYSGYYYFGDKTDDKQIYNLTKENIQNLNEFVKQFDLADKNVQDLLYKAISLYYQGLTEKKVNYSFLNFWTALEIITLKKKGIPHTEIINRLKSIIPNLTQLDRHKIDRIYSLRNNLVHDGAYNITQYDRNLLKIYLELMVEFFMFRLVKYNAQEIQMIFQFLQKDNTALNKSKEIIDFVTRLRKGE